MTEHDTTHDWPCELRLDEDAGPAAYISRANVDGMIASALDQAGFSAAAPSQTGRYVARSAKPVARIGARSLAAAVLVACVGVGSASAAVMWFGRSERAQLESPSPVVDKPREHKPVVRAEPATVSPVEAVAPEPAVSEPAPARSHARAPEDWLVEGNRLRAEQRWSKADAAYTHAAQQARHGQTAYVARVASAAVRLEHLDDARGALTLYRAALRKAPHGALSEEIHWGIAEAYRALGDAPAERAALELFVREHPSSPLVKQARARLD